MAAPPVISTSTPAADIITASGAVPVSVTASGALCARLEVRDGAGTSVSTADLVAAGADRFDGAVSLPADGRYSLTFRATTNAGCDYTVPSDGASRRVDITVDSTAPSPFSISNPLISSPSGSGQAVIGRGASVELAWDRPADTGTGVAHYEVVVSGTERVRTAATRAFLPLAGVANLSPLQIIAVDNAGNRRAISPNLSLVIDNAGPGITWLEPSARWLRGNVNLRVRAREDGLGSGLARVGYTTRTVLPGGAVPSANIGEVSDIDPDVDVDSARVPWNTKTFATRDGRYELTAFALDRAGNLSLAKRVVFIDNTAPRFTTRKRAFTLRAKGTATLAIRVQDKLAPNLRVSWVVRKAGSRKNFLVSREKLVRDSGTQRLRVPVGRLAPGAYRLTLQVKDLAGNFTTRAYVLRLR